MIERPGAADHLKVKPTPVEVVQHIFEQLLSVVPVGGPLRSAGGVAALLDRIRTKAVPLTQSESKLDIVAAHLMGQGVGEPFAKEFALLDQRQPEHLSRLIKHEHEQQNALTGLTDFEKETLIIITNICKENAQGIRLNTLVRKLIASPNDFPRSRRPNKKRTRRAEEAMVQRFLSRAVLPKLIALGKVVKVKEGSSTYYRVA